MISNPATEPRRLVRDVLLRDGSTLRLQAPTPADFGDIKEFFDRLSIDGRAARFHGYARTDIAARAAAEAAGDDRCTLIARHDGRVVAVAGFDGLREPSAAEVAFAVADDFQGRGAGTRMLEQLADIAAQRGITRFDAEVRFANQAMLGVFEGAGFAVRRRVWDGEMTVSLDITPTDAVRERIEDRDHSAAVASLQPLLAPSSIAIVGEWGTRGSVARTVLENLVVGKFRGVVAPVSRGDDVVCSMRAARSVSALGFVPELVVIAAAGEEAVEEVAEAATGGARALLVLPAGPDDHAHRAGERDERLLGIVRESGLRMVGPSALGVINTDPDVGLNATFSAARVRPGGLAIGAEAVAPGIGLLGHAEARQMGISVLVSIGGNVDVSTNDLLEWCEADRRTAVVMLYVESFGDPERFTRVAQRVSRRKPILVIKGRRSEDRGGSHVSESAAAVRGDAVIDAVLSAAGVMRFHNSEDLFHVAQLFESEPLPSGRRIGIISNSASVATLAADACARDGLQTAHPDGRPEPVLLRLGAGPEDYAACASKLLGEAGIDALIACYVDHPDGDPEGVLEAVSAARAEQSKPAVACVVRADGRLPASRRGAAPNYLFPESCVAVLARAAQRREWLARPLGVRPDYDDVEPGTARELISTVLQAGKEAGGWLSRREAEVLLSAYRIPLADSHRCRDLRAAVAAAKEIGEPVLLKAEFAPGGGSDINAVLVGLDGEAMLRAGWRELQRRVHIGGGRWIGAIVERIAAPGADLLVGVLRDPELGPVIALGLGGRRAGAGEGVACRRPPATDIEADELIDSSPAVAAVLGDGAPARLDRPSFRELILRFARLATDVPEVVDADLNPVRCSAGGSLVLGMRIRIEPQARRDRVRTW